MFNFCNLYSGSSGNCSVIQVSNTNILVDCGVSHKRIEKSLETIGLTFNSIDAIVITHEHSDHIKGLGTTCKLHDIPIYANQKTTDAIRKLYDVKNSKIFNTNEDFTINELKIHSFSIPHDAVEPCGFTFSYGNKKISIATDIGHMENSILKNIEGSDFLLLESNYEPDILKCSNYPYMLKKRILGPNGHLSNEDASKAISELVSSGLNNVMLGHLSKENNFPELAYKTTMNELIMNNRNSSKLKLQVALRDNPNEIIKI